MSNAPDFTKPIDILAFLYNELGACGCFEFGPFIQTIKELLEWANAEINTRAKYITLLGGNVGVYYFLMGRLDSLRLIEHGSSIRNPWLTPLGKVFLNALNTFTAEQIEDSNGEAYDGLTYGAWR